jgi:hypothetical protein
MEGSSGSEFCCVKLLCFLMTFVRFFRDEGEELLTICASTEVVGFPCADADSAVFFFFLPKKPIMIDLFGQCSDRNEFYDREQKCHYK